VKRRANQGGGESVEQNRLVQGKDVATLKGKQGTMEGGCQPNILEAQSQTSGKIKRSSDQRVEKKKE